MLILSRKKGESITIGPASDLDPRMTIGNVFQSGPIEISILQVGASRTRLTVKAPQAFRIWRGARTDVEEHDRGEELAERTGTAAVEQT